MRYRFAGFVLDDEALRLFKGDQNVPVEPQVFDLIKVLVTNPGRVVTKDELVESVWQGRIVSDATISSRINAARSALDDDGQRQALIRTVPRRGIELQVPVELEDAVPAVAKLATEPMRQRIKYTKSRDGTRIAYATSGSGPPLLRTSHHLSHLELDWNSAFWRPMFARLSAENTLVRYDVRGTGLSDANLEGAGIEDYLADMEAVAEAAGLEQFALVSNLQSTPVAIRFIAENPGRVTRFVVHSGYVRGRAMRTSAASQSSDPVISLMQNGWGDPNNGFMRAWVSMIIPYASHQEVTDMIVLLSGVASPENVVAARRIIDRFTAEGLLDKVKVPTLVIHARSDTIHPVDEARELAMGIEGAELMIVESNHTLTIPSDPTWDEQMDATMEFLAEG